jgi:ankyrin repeat protein
MTLTEVETLLEAIKAGQADRVREIVEREPASASGRTQRGESPVLTAAYYGRDEILRVLAERASLDVFEAAVVGALGRLSALLSKVPALVRARSYDGWTPLHLAAFFGQPAAAERLLQAGADPLAVSDNSTANQPLHAALAGREDRRVVELLIAGGADVRARAAAGYTPLHLAASRGNQELIDLLLKSGADPNVMSDDGQTPATIAAARGKSVVLSV